MVMKYRVQWYSENESLGERGGDRSFDSMIPALDFYNAQCRAGYRARILSIQVVYDEIESGDKVIATQQNFPKEEHLVPDPNKDEGPHVLTVSEVRDIYQQHELKAASPSLPSLEVCRQADEPQKKSAYDETLGGSTLTPPRDWVSHYTIPAPVQAAMQVASNSLYSRQLREAAEKLILAYLSYDWKEVTPRS